ncbi:glycine cleavage system transcriptional repressor [Alteromonas pelagimontana]|uniref:Glycine cleavage system transcriptional repressor n=1 Tax=Alteromonas pelagimontana TaxID=1858656 RepID=A0A6M4M8R1_9ALTE|nr:glycine cleavage system transcriptional repressor [Alteromonas pelagimontana]QJR79369.1 glycine cleavage system transcriptional repressor [Alteromonas pelagimontana]
MKQQLIVTILGTDRSGILSEIATTVSEVQCNILDSRQAIYGKEFSLTMILEGNHQAITRAECLIPPLCQRLDLLSLMKRTSHHEKQNIEHVFEVEFSGVDAAGLIKSVTRFFADRNASINAFRQRTFTDEKSGEEMMRCKLMVTVPDSVDFGELEYSLKILFDSLKLTGKVIDKYKKDKYANSASW